MPWLQVRETLFKLGQQGSVLLPAPESAVAGSLQMS